MLLLNEAMAQLIIPPHGSGWMASSPFYKTAAQVKLQIPPTAVVDSSSPALFPLTLNSL